ncbi:ABC transporter substrate-binding protein [Tabrizicola sp.]|uniref:ABC transporter substrate-binding protein n=1 Tax=Tabrizicola sp. TaxID=2005166 RepID=UPI00261DB3A8|nr:ABC transporter substrate-binding protein [Tabrizicola sp.]MDM7931511.1 ABC transporter substrate-binding protein [Tabrizicola sp.]
MTTRFLTTAAALAMTTALTVPALAADCPIKIGATAPLSAPGAVTGGEAMRDAMAIAEADINAAGGVLGCEVQVIVADDEGLPERGRAVMERLITQDGVVAVGGGYHSSVGLANMEVADAAGIPVVYAETWNDGITGKGLKHIFRIAPLSSEVARIFADFAATVPGVKKVVLVAENTDYGLPASEQTKAGLEKSGITSSVFTVDIGTQDFSGIIERIKAEDPDMIIQLLTGEASYNFTQQSAEAGIGPQDLPTTCDQAALESGAFWQNVPDGNLCFVNAVGLPRALYNDKTNAFVAAYTARTGKSAAESYAMEAYDSIMILAEAMKIAGSTDGDAIVTALENITYQGTLGEISFPYNSTNPPAAAGVAPYFWHQFPNPAVTMVQYQEPGQLAADAPNLFPPQFKTGEPVWPASVKQ